MVPGCNQAVAVCLCCVAKQAAHDTTRSGLQSSVPT